MSSLVLQTVFCILSVLIAIPSCYIAFSTTRFFTAKASIDLSTTSPETTPTSVNLSITGTHSQKTRKRKLKSTNKKKDQIKLIQYSVISCSAIFLINIICITFDQLYGILRLPAQLTNPVLLVSIYVSYFIGRILLSLIFILRLKYTFDNTFFEYSKCQIRSLLSIWTLMVFCAVVVSITSGVFRDTEIEYLLNVGGTSLFLFVDVLLSFILLYLFLRKLYIVFMQTKDEVLLRITTKYALLYTVCYSTTIACMAVIIYVGVILMGRGNDILFQKMIAQCVACDSFFSILCLWLKLPSASKPYNCLCYGLDLCCTVCCTQCIRCCSSLNGLSHDEKNVEIAIKPQSSNTNSNAPPQDNLESQFQSLEIQSNTNTAVIS